MSPSKLNHPAPRGSHRAHPHAPAPVEPESLWSRYTKTRNWLIGTASAIVTLGAAVTFVAPYAEAVTPVTHTYYRTIVLPRVIHAQLDVNQERRERLLGVTKERELELSTATTPQYKARIQESIDRAAVELKTLGEDDKSLFKEQKEKTR